MKYLVVLSACFLAASCAPEGSPDFKPAPVYARPTADYVADQPISSPEPVQPLPTKVSPMANIRPVEPQPIYGLPEQQYVPVPEQQQVYGPDTTYVQTYNPDPYNQGYGVQTGYEGYLVPAGDQYYPVAPHDGGIGALGYLWSILPHAATVVAVAAKAVKVIVSGAAVVIAGAAVVLGICTFTPFCSISIARWDSQTITDEVRSFITPDRISTAARFVREAIDKYQKMQKTN